MDPRKLLDEIENEVEEAEHELKYIEDESESMKKKHETADNLLEEIHEQIDFLRELAEK